MIAEGSQVLGIERRFISVLLWVWAIYLVAQVLSPASLDYLGSYLVRLGIGALGTVCVWRSRRNPRHWSKLILAASVIYLAWFVYRQSTFFILEGSDLLSVWNGVLGVLVFHALSVSHHYARDYGLWLFTDLYTWVLMPALQVAAIAFVVRHAYLATSNRSLQSGRAASGPPAELGR